MGERLVDRRWIRKPDGLTIVADADFVPAGGRETIGRSAESGRHYLTGVALDMALEAVAETPDPGLADGAVEGVEIVFEGAVVEGDVHVLGKTVDDAVDLGE